MLGANLIKGYKKMVRYDLVKGFNHPVRSGLIRGIQDTSSRNDTLLEDLQIVFRINLLKDLVQCYNG